MAGASILAVPGLGATTPEFRRELWALAQRNGWEVDALATVISVESGFKAAVQNPLKGQTASGLIQFTDATARGLGIADGAAGVRRMSALEQLPYVERYFQRAFAGRTPRPVDYYLAVLGGGAIGKPAEHVLFRKSDPRSYNGGKDNLYTLNAGLDRDANGEVSVSDISALLASRAAQAGGQRIEVGEAAAPLAEARASASAPLSSPARLRLLSQLCVSLPVLSSVSAAPLAHALDWVLMSNSSNRTASYQDLQRKLAARGLYTGKIDGEVGPKTWRAILELLASEAGK